MKPALQYALPTEWEQALRSRLSMEPLPPSKPFSQVRDFGWLTFDLPSQYFTRSSFCWYVELVATLREALAHVAHAAAVGSDVLHHFADLHAFEAHELSVRYRFGVGSRIADITYLLDQRQAYSSAFQRAQERLLLLQPSRQSPPALLRVPVSLVVKPEQWTPTLLNEISFLCKAHRPSNSSVESFVYDIVDVQLDLLDTKLPETALLSLMAFLQSDVPLSVLSLTIQDAQWTRQDVLALIKVVDRPSIASLTINLPAATHYELVMHALSKTVHVHSVSISVQTHGTTEVSAHRASSSSAQALQLTSPNLTIPQQFAAIESLSLASSNHNWESQPGVFGRRLRVLQLFTAPASDPVELPLQAVLDACPGLLCLDLKNVQIDSLDALLKAYESGSCQLRSLALHGAHIARIDSVFGLARSLMDTNSPVAHHLLEFSWIPASQEVAIELVDTFADVLDANPRVRFLQLESSRETLSARRLLKHQFRPLLPYGHPLLHRPAHRLGLLGTLNHDTVGHILAFTGIHEMRRVRLHRTYTRNR